MTLPWPLRAPDARVKRPHGPCCLLKAAHGPWRGRPWAWQACMMWAVCCTQQQDPLACCSWPPAPPVCSQQPVTLPPSSSAAPGCCAELQPRAHGRDAHAGCRGAVGRAGDPLGPHGRQHGRQVRGRRGMSQAEVVIHVCILQQPHGWQHGRQVRRRRAGCCCNACV